MDMIRQAGELSLYRLCKPCHNDKESFLRLDVFDGLVIERPFVCADENALHGGRHFGKRRSQKFDSPRSSMYIAGTKFSVPEVLGNAVEAQKRVVGRPAPLLGVVADQCHLLLS